MRLPTGVISSRSPFRAPSFSMTAPTHSLGHVHHQPLDGLALLAVDGLVQHAGGRDLELIALPAHGLNEDGQAHFATARHVEGVGGAIDAR